MNVKPEADRIRIILIFRQVFALWKAKKHRQKLMSSSVQQNARDADRENQMNRTTRMLVVVIFLFLIPILPYEMIYVMNGEKLKYLGLFHFWICFLEFQDFFQMLLALDAATNFLVYYFMSSQFRKTYHILFNCNTFAAGKNFLRNKASNRSTAEETPVQLSSLEKKFSHSSLLITNNSCLEVSTRHKRWVFLKKTMFAFP